MKKLLAVLVASFVLTSCSEKKAVPLTEEQIANRALPAYCIRDVEFFENEEGRFAILDMPYYRHWTNTVDEQQPMTVTREWYDTQEGIPFCQENDPRLG